MPLFILHCIFNHLELLNFTRSQYHANTGATLEPSPTPKILLIKNCHTVYTMRDSATTPFIEPLRRTSLPILVIYPRHHRDLFANFQGICGRNIYTIFSFISNTDCIPVFTLKEFSIFNNLGIQTVSRFIKDPLALDVVKREVNNKPFSEICCSVSCCDKYQNK